MSAFIVSPSTVAAEVKCERILERFYEGFAEIIQQVGEDIEGHSLYENASDQEKAEGIRMATAAIRQQIGRYIMTDPDFPVFVRGPDPTTKQGLDNPDNLYLNAFIEEDALPELDVANSGEHGCRAPGTVSIGRIFRTRKRPGPHRDH